MRVLVRGEPVMELDRRPWESVEKASEVRDREEDEKVGLGLARTPRPPIRVSLGWGWALGPFRRDLCPFRSKPLF